MKALLLLAISLLSVKAFPQTLEPGMPAPELQVGTWVKGQPVNTFDKDTSYVMEFWATWCVPCREAIPHLTELSKKYKRTKFIGVAVAETNTKDVAPFVARMGKKMDYNVAIDKQESATAREGFMSTNWLQAAAIDGIPATFVVSNNQIAWIGHPMQLDSVLESIYNNKWDTQKFAAEYKKQKAEEMAITKAMEQFQETLTAHAKNKDKKQFYKTLEAELTFMSDKFGLPSVNDQIWYWIADPKATELTSDMKDYSFATKWMEKVTASPAGKDAAFFDTLAHCYFGAGNKQKAVETQKAALRLLPADAEGRNDYEQTLKEFQR